MVALATGAAAGFTAPIGGTIILAAGLAGFRLLATGRERSRFTQRKRWSYLAGVLLLAGMESWPALELARSWSVTAYVSHNLVIVLAAVPLILLGIPSGRYRRLLDLPAAGALAGALSRPIPAIVAYSALMAASMLPPVVALQARSVIALIYLQLLLLAAGVALWLPALHLLPGTRWLSTAARVGYLVAQSLVPSIPAIALIFAHHSFYPGFARGAHLLFGVSAVADQQLAGVVSKLLNLGVLWTVAVRILVKASNREAAGEDPEPMTWADVERELRERRPPCGDQPGENPRSPG